MTVAAFDWDGTLTVRDCVVPFLVRVAGIRRLGGRLLASPGSLAVSAVRRDRDRLKQLGVSAAFTGRSVHQVDDLGRRYADHVWQHWMRPDTLARLRWHQASGHRVVIVSASLGPYLRPLADRLGADAVVCTELATFDGRYTGELDGPNCRGVHKVHRLQAHLAQWNEPGEVGWAYGDSQGDDALLALAECGIRVGRSRLDAIPDDRVSGR